MQLFRKTLYDVGLSTNNLHSIANVENAMTCTENPYTTDILKEMKKETKKEKDSLVLQNLT